MKYMGSKRAMLGNGLGEAIDGAMEKANRVFDLFTGSGAVACHVAENYEKKVIASDLQLYSVVLANAVISRTEAMNNLDWVDEWFTSSEMLFASLTNRIDIDRHQEGLAGMSPQKAAEIASHLTINIPRFPISSAYSGHYFSPWQAAWLDCLRNCLPLPKDQKSVALAALIKAASRCAASPGHTAQPFKANDTAGPYLLESWKRDLPNIVRSCVSALAVRKARLLGEAHCIDALLQAEEVKEGDLAFIDPPYSGVHYSRFYHVLESVARGHIGPVSGIGRYPPREERPSSDFSLSTKSRTAFDDLLASLSGKGATVIITFPAGKASNGLSGDDVKEMASAHFAIEEEKVSGRFSTLGGDRKHRAARLDSQELILKLSAQ